VIQNAADASHYRSGIGGRGTDDNSGSIQASPLVCDDGSGDRTA